MRQVYSAANAILETAFNLKLHLYMSVTIWCV